MNILFVASRFPWPLTHGDRLRAYHQLRLLSRQHRITLLSPKPDTNVEESQFAVQPFCEKIVTVAMPLWKRWWQLGQMPFTNLPLQTLYTYNPQLRRQAEQLLREGTFDLVHVQLMRMAPTAAEIQEIPKTIDFIDALSLNMGRRAEREAWYRAWIFRWEARRAHRYEQELLSLYHQAIVSTQLDYEALGAHSRLKVATNGVDPEHVFVTERRDTNVIAFTGHISYFPNADAAIWFVTHVLPLVQQQVPGAQFQIIGADPPPAVRMLTRQAGVEVTGYVPSVIDYLQRATLAVAPMQCGSGIQNKVLEAMVCGAPMVVTPFALGGLDVRHGEHLLIADNATDFANQVVQLLQDEQLRRKLATNASRLIDEKYSWEQSVAQLETAYAQSIYEYNHREKLAEAYPTRTAEVVRVRFDAPIAAGVQFRGSEAAQAYAFPSLSRLTTEHRSYLTFKRFLDIFSAVIGVGVMLLLCPLIWLVNQLTSPGNLFYVQERVGQDGRPFRMIKFRSMVMMAEADTGPMWAELDDPRITPFGRILRKSRLDELPQFLNVLRGEMSLIGPRPERPEFVKTLVKTFPEFEVRHVVKPGITGWAQINYRYVASIDDTQIKLQYDLEYIKHQSIRLDLLIILKTVLVMLRMQGH